MNRCGLALPGHVRARWSNQARGRGQEWLGERDDPAAKSELAVADIGEFQGPDLPGAEGVEGDQSDGEGGGGPTVADSLVASGVGRRHPGDPPNRVEEAGARVEIIETAPLSPEEAADIEPDRAPPLRPRPPVGPRSPLPSGPAPPSSVPPPSS